ncbi:MAG: acylneuraminate cytidylyltransferase family protein [Alteromonadaceae bacterium]|nr:acylneuraminate cytidylyltransferase family protein [Alteromonadaceae bacterium]
MTKKVLGIIPARGGSKGVKRKNIRTVAGQPLIYWSIKSAKESNVLDFCCVNTDDDEIANVAAEYGSDVIMRPPELAQDETPMLPVLQYVCEQAEAKFGKFDTIVLLQPTAPMREAKDIQGAVEAFHINCESRSLVSVYQVDDCHPSRMYRIENGTLCKIFAEPQGSLRQDLEPIYHRNGALYICERDLLMKKNLLICEHPIPYVMSKANSANIDDEEDLFIADKLMQRKYNLDESPN